MQSRAVPGYLITAIAEAKTLKALHAIADRYLDDFGFSRFAFHLVRQAEFNDRILTVLTDYPDEWLKRYADKDYIYSDPVHNHSLHNMQPFTWSRLQTVPLPKQAALIFDEARQFGIQDGISVPVHGPHNTFSLFSAVADGTAIEQADALRSYGQSVAQLAVLLHERAVQLLQVKGTFDDGAPKLTPREREVIKWIASGKTTPDIAEILKIAETTVNSHAHAAAEKLNATTRAHASVLAVLAGIVDPV